MAETDKERMIRRHATVFIGGVEIPLIGIPRDSVLQDCDCCGETITLSQSNFTGTQILCAKCLSDPSKPT